MEDGAVGQLHIAVLVVGLGLAGLGIVDLQHFRERNRDLLAALVGEDDFLVRDADDVAANDALLEGVNIRRPDDRRTQEHGEQSTAKRHNRPPRNEESQNSVVFTAKRLHIKAEGKRSATLGNARTTFPVFTPKG